MAQRTRADRCHHAADPAGPDRPRRTVALAEVRLADLASFRAAIVTNSLGIAPVSAVDDLVLPTDGAFVRIVAEAYESVPWEPV